MPVETPVRRRRRVRRRPRLIPCLLALVAVLLVVKWIDPFAPGGSARPAGQKAPRPAPGGWFMVRGGPGRRPP